MEMSQLQQLPPRRLPQEKQRTGGDDAAWAWSTPQAPGGPTSGGLAGCVGSGAGGRFSVGRAASESDLTQT
uniref:Uncharacterized protein n=1 Tax=Arundo donax TaxID=35708 RepID=A0A0A8YZF2_ARUDO